MSARKLSAVDASANGYDPEAAQRIEGGLLVANDCAELPDDLAIVASIERGEGADAEYDLHFAHGVVAEGIRLSDVYAPRVMQPRLEQVTKRALPWRSPKEWQPFGTGIVRAAVPDETTGGRADEAREWLAEFLDGHLERGPVDLLDPDALFDALERDHGAFRGSDGRLYVRPSRLLIFVNRVYGQRTTHGDLRRRLARLGFERPASAEGKLSARKGARTVSRRFLVSDPDFDPGA